MRGLYLYPVLKKTGSMHSTAPFLSFLAPASIVSGSIGWQFLNKTIHLKRRTRPFQLRPYSTTPKPPRIPETTEERSSKADTGPKTLSTEERPDETSSSEPEVWKYPSNGKKWRRVLSTPAGWANHKGNISAKRGPTLIRRIDKTTKRYILRYTTEIPPQDQPSTGEYILRYTTQVPPEGQSSTDEYDPRKDKKWEVGGVFGAGKEISAYEMTNHLLSKGRRVTDIELAWVELHIWEKDFNIEDMVLWLTELGRVHIAARILEAIYGSFKPEAVGNSYAIIIYTNLTSLAIPKGEPYWISFREKQAQRLLRLLKVFFRPDYTTKIHFRTIQKTQFVVYSLCKNLPPEELAGFYKYLVECGLQFRVYTVLHFIDRLCKEGDFYKGYILMRCMIEEKRDLQTSLCRKAFTLMLSKATKADNVQASGDIIKAMYDCGLAADTPIYNVLIYNAIKSGKIETALTIYRKLYEEGLKPNRVTYALLFNLHKQTGNVEEQQKIIRMTMEIFGRLSQWMAADVIHAAVLKADKGRKFRDAVQVFTKIYAPGVLGLLGLVPMSNDGKPDQDERMTPDVVAVTIVTLAYLQDETDTERIWRLYQRYKQLLHSQEHSQFFELQPVMANGFLYRFGQELRTMDKALEVMQDLTAPSPLRWRLQVRPNRFSWSILAKAFTRHRRLEEAQWVLRSMRRDGFQPTEVTWERLLSAYLEVGKVEEAGETLGMMLADGIKLREHILHMLASVEKNEEFASGVERIRKGGEWGTSRREAKGVALNVGQAEPKLRGNDWKEIEDVRKQERAEFAEHLKKREMEEGYAEKSKPLTLPELSINDI